MSTRGRSTTPRRTGDEDVDMGNPTTNGGEKPEAKVIVVTNLTRNVVEGHLKIIFGVYGQISKVDLPLYGKSGQNRGKAALEYDDASGALKAASHMNGGQLDGNVLKVELSEHLITARSRSRSFHRSRSPRRSRSRSRPRPPLNGRGRPPRSFSCSRSRSRSPPPYRRRYPDPRPFRGRSGFARRGPPGRDTYRDTYRPRSRSRSRSRSPLRRGFGRLPPRRRSPSYVRGGHDNNQFGRGRRSISRSRSRSYSVRSSRSRTRSVSRSRSRSRSRSSYSSYSKNSRSRSRSAARGRRSPSREDIRDSRSRSPRN